MHPSFTHRIIWYRLLRTSATLLLGAAVYGTMMFWPRLAIGAGVLAPTDGSAPLQIVDHEVSVVIDNGFAQTTVVQSFTNPNAADMEAVYTFPAPQDATLADVVIRSGETTLSGEVLAKDDARNVYTEEMANGNDAGLAESDGYQQFRFHVYPVRAGATTVVSFTYYQALHIDSGIGRYAYPLEEGGTDEPSFWTRNDSVSGRLSVDVDLRTAYPVSDVRSPGLEGSARVDQIDPNHWRLQWECNGGTLKRDFVFYYRLQDNLPGRVELIPYKAGPDGQGTFMLVITPGLDLQPLEGGVDYVFVLDVSGSMADKLSTLSKGVQQAIGKLRPQDNFRVVTFSHNARELIPWQAATPGNVQAALQKIAGLRSEGGTNLEAAIGKALDGLREERVTTMVLVTDGVANVGDTSPAHFHKLLQQYDLRLFGFLMGNSANFPLMKVLCDATGGYYAAVSNSDDIVGQILLAKDKVTREALQDVHLQLASESVRMSGLTGDSVGKVFHGQQLVLFGRYEGSGDATLRLTLRVSGQDRVIELPIRFPEVDPSFPELERLWALQRVQDSAFLRDMGMLPADEAADAIRALGVEYQLVTDETSMVVLDDAAHDRHGIERRNEQRVQREVAAQAIRAQQPAQDHTQAQGGSLGQRSGNLGGGQGGGAIDPFSGLAIIGGLLGSLALRGKRRASAGTDR